MSATPRAGGSEVQDNIRVVARFRPVLAHEIKKMGGAARRGAEFPAVDFLPDGASVALYGDLGRGGGGGGGGGEDRKHFFTFDSVLQPGTKEGDVYDAVARPSIESLMEGYNSTIFAYGQTGAGKTHTMMGTQAEPGIIPRAIRHIFDEIEDSDAGTSYQMRATFVEIYNETVRDLLDPKLKELRVRDMSGFSYIEDVREVPITTEEDVHDLLKRGSGSRATASHDMNDASSRSHSIFILYLVATTSDGNRRTSILNLCDLAGSEKLKKTNATGDRMKESVNINQSLSSLANCIQALAENKRGAQIPYRNSKLTQILQRSLGGNCKTTLVVACSPSETEVSETTNSCRFGQRAKAIKLSAKKNEQRCEAMVRRSAELRALEQKLQDLQDENRQLWADSDGQLMEEEHSPVHREPPSRLNVFDWMRSEIERLHGEIAVMETENLTLREAASVRAEEQRRKAEVERREQRYKEDPLSPQTRSPQLRGRTGGSRDSVSGDGGGGAPKGALKGESKIARLSRLRAQQVMLLQSQSRSGGAASAMQGDQQLTGDVESSEMLRQLGGLDGVLGALRREPERAEVQKVGCGMLGMLVSAGQQGARISRDELVTAGTIQVLLTAIQNHPSVPAVQQNGLLVLDSLSTDPRWHDQMTQHSGIEVLVASLREWSSSASLQCQVYKILSQLAATSATRADSAWADGINISIAATSQHPAATALHGNVWALLQELASEGPTQARLIEIIVDAGALEALVKSLRKHVDAESVQTNACALLQMVVSLPEFRADVADSGAVDAVSEAMLRMSDCEVLQLGGCAVLLHLSSEPSCLECVMGGAIDAVVQAMDRNMLSSSVQQNASGVLLNLSASGGAAQNVIVQAGGIESIVTAMFSFPAVAQLQVHGIKTLAFLAPTATFRQRLVEFGAVEVALTVMHAFPELLDVQLNGCGMLQNLATSAEIQSMVAQLNGVKIVLHSMNVHQGTLELQAVGMGLLQNLAATSENCVAIGKSVAALSTQPIFAPSLICAGWTGALDGPNAMIQAMLRFPEHAEIQKNGCGALRNLAFDADNAATVMQLDGAQVVLDSMRRHSGVPSVQQNACGCLQNLASTSQHRALLLSHGAVDTVLAAMRRFPSEPVVQENSCGALANLASSRAPLERMLDAGVVEEVVSAIHYHAEEPNVMQNACGCLGMVPESLFHTALCLADS
jgi:hypothetical protein